MSKPYWQQLLDPRWQKRRLEILNRAGFKCECCGDSENTLNIHHRYYERGLMAWEYPDAALVSVCADCHELLADAERIILRELPRDPMEVFFIARQIADKAGREMVSGKVSVV